MPDALNAEFDNSGEVINGSTYLEVNITSGSLFNDVFKDLVWYYNEYVISVTSNFTFPDGNTSLQTQVYSEGTFKVRYEGLLVIPQDQACEKSLLDTLTHYPAFRSAKFYKFDLGELHQFETSFISIEIAKIHV